MIYFHRDNTLTLFNAEDELVYGKDITQYGDRWVLTNITKHDDPMNWNGGFSHSLRVYADTRGMIYYQ